MKNIFACILLLSTLSAYSQKEPREFPMTEGDTTYIMKKYIICFLKKGPNRDQNKEEAEKIQKGHMDNLNKLAEEGKLSIAGPIGDDSDVQGILIFDLETVEEAKKLTEVDPAVKSGRLVMEFHPWWAAKGSKLP